ncbi:MAG: hypothetical protein QM533_02225 [Cytophagales bacterium]|nr:hypothetical protein [Cytophagales bacterium]
MTLAQMEWAWLDTPLTINQQDLSHCCGLAASDLDELIEYNALVPISPNVPPLFIKQAAGETIPIEQVFSSGWIAPLREVGRLRVDFDIDIFTMALLLVKMNRIETLERQLATLRAQVPFHTS